MRSTSMFSCIMIMIFNFSIFLSFKYLFSRFFYKYNRFLHFHMIPATLWLVTSFFSFENYLFSLRVLLNIHKTFSYYFYLYIHHAFLSLLNGVFASLCARELCVLYVLSVLACFTCSRTWRAYVLGVFGVLQKIGVPGVLHKMAYLACCKTLASLTCFIKLYAWLQKIGVLGGLHKMTCLACFIK